MERRNFIISGLASTAGIGLARRAEGGAGSIRRSHDRPLKILFLGGTGFVGPAIVDLALARGHEVTLFNRGQTNPWLFTCLERLRGDRTRMDGLSAIAGERSWDIVIDTWQGSPLAVDAAARVLQNRTRAYVYTSSIAVYQGQNYQRERFDESAELPNAVMPDSLEADLAYPARKQLGEQAVRASFPGGSIVLRSYGIRGLDPRGRLDQDIPYWPARILRGGRILAPGDGADRLQWTDLRDLADFVLHAIENGIRGTFNVSTGTTFRRYLDAIAELCRNDSHFRWVPASFLFDRGLESFTDVPSWVWREEHEKGFFAASNARALEAGLRPRSTRETFRPIIDSLRLHHADLDLTGDDGFEIARREAELLQSVEDEDGR